MKNTENRYMEIDDSEAFYPVPPMTKRDWELADRAYDQMLQKGKALRRKKRDNYGNNHKDYTHD